jgi:hypothetical protein
MQSKALAAIRRASSRVSRSTAADVGERLPVGVADDEAGVRLFD